MIFEQGSHIGFKLITFAWFLFSANYMSETINYRKRKIKLLEKQNDATSKKLN